MTSPKSSTAFVSPIPAGLGEHVERSLNYHVDLDGRINIGDGPDIELLIKLDNFVRLSLESKFPPFRIAETTGWRWVDEADANGLMHRVRRPFNVRTPSPDSTCPASERVAALWPVIWHAATIFACSTREANQLLYAPHLRRLCEVFLAHPISAYLDCNIGSQIDGQGRIVAEVYNDFVAHFLRVFVAEKLLRRPRHNWRLGSDENVVNLHTYLDKLFARHPSLSILHMRFFVAGNPTCLIPAPLDDSHSQLEDLRGCRKVFFDRMRRRRSLFTHDPGYVWSILPTHNGGYSLHLTLLFDTVALRKIVNDKKAETKEIGAVLQNHADQAGAYWVDVATEGRGSYLRADQNLWLYGPDWVHGEVRADDLERRQTLARMLGCLAMRRALIRLKSEPAGKYFGIRDRKVHAPRGSRKDGEQLLKRR